MPVLAIVLVLAGSAMQATRGSAPGQSAAVEAALARVAPSLVRVHVVAIDYQDGRELKRESSGSGTIITPEGHVLTNHHVAGRTRSIVCTLANREEVPASSLAPIRCRTSPSCGFDRRPQGNSRPRRSAGRIAQSRRSRVGAR
jgi:S1-C subfamily serine protease